MDLSQVTCPRYLSEEIEENKIGSVGCNYLSQTDLRDLEAIGLCTICRKVDNNKVGDSACKVLSRAEWRLKEIWLGIFVDM